MPHAGAAPQPQVRPEPMSDTRCLLFKKIERKDTIDLDIPEYLVSESQQCH